LLILAQALHSLAQRWSDVGGTIALSLDCSWLFWLQQLLLLLLKEPQIEVFFLSSSCTVCTRFFFFFFFFSISFYSIS
jgi:hypothetical protein